MKKIIKIFLGCILLCLTLDTLASISNKKKFKNTGHRVVGLMRRIREQQRIISAAAVKNRKLKDQVVQLAVDNVQLSKKLEPPVEETQALIATHLALAHSQKKRICL